MSDNLETVWDLEPHTFTKHVILRNYLRAWFPIMGNFNQRILFMDAYAGPGKYKKEGTNSFEPDGSPIIALKEAMNYLTNCERHGWTKPEIVFIFIENDKKRFDVLENIIHNIHIPKEIKVQLINSTFEDMANDMVTTLENKNLNLAPAFLFIDPLGYNLPFELIQQLMKYDKCEVFINFMYEFINRFIERDGQENVMTRLFGTEDWKELNLNGLKPAERRSAIHDFYQKQLQERAAKFVRSFEMRGVRNATKYFLFYGTNHQLGLQKMKESMWKVDTEGTFSFSDSTDPNQLVLFGGEPDYPYLKQLILDRFSGKEVSIEEIEDYVLCETAFLPSHIKRQILKPMENNKEIVVTESPRKRSGSYPDGTKIKFN